MSDVIKKATREGYGQALVELGAKYPNMVVLDADLAGATKTNIFAKKCIFIQKKCILQAKGQRLRAKGW